MKNILLNLTVLLVVFEIAQANEFNVFESSEYQIYAQSTDQPRPELSLPALRFREVRLNPVISDTAALNLGDKLNFSIFDDTFYTASIDKVTRNINGTVTVRARIEGSEMGYVLISTTRGRSLGTVRLPEEGVEYEINFSDEIQSHYVIDVDIDAVDVIADSELMISPVLERSDNYEILKLQDATARDPYEMVNIDVMIVYTPAARSVSPGIENTISQAMGKAQLVLDNSNTMLTLTLVYSGEINYTESGTPSTDLRRLTNPGDGYMDSVHVLRNQYGADLVSLFANLSGTGGSAWLLKSLAGEPDDGFSLIRVQQAANFYTYIHEIGHNLGCHHHKEQNYQPGPNTSLGAYTAGWRWVGNDAKNYCSVMSYEDGQYFADGLTHRQVPYFSNPNIYHQGKPTGNAAGGDNARIIRATKFAVASYREQAVYIPGSGTSSDPYRISTAEQLNKVNDDLSAYYVLVADIDLAAQGYTKAVIAPYASSSSAKFAGLFNGNGFAVKNLTISGGANNHIGLFGQIDSSAVVSGVVIQNANISGNDNVGILAGSSSGLIQECYVSGQVTARYSVGALVGSVSGGSVIRSAANSTVTASLGSAGGLCGRNVSAQIRNCYAVGSVSGNGSTYGGLCGSNSGQIINSYAAALVSGGQQVGGLIGNNSGSALNCFWDMQVSAQQTSAAGIGKSTAQVKDITTFGAMGWDFAQTWQMSNAATEFDGYPVLIWQDISSPYIEIPLVQGWNWISFNVLPENRALGNVLLNYSVADNDVIIASDGKNATYYGGIWYGTLTDIKAGAMYRLKSYNGGLLTVYGNYVNVTTEIQLVGGWNWLGYCLTNARPLSQAVESLIVSNNDVIIASDGKNATYYNGFWYGTLTEMQPGRGYMLKVAEAQTFSFETDFSSTIQLSSIDIASFAEQWLMIGYGLKYDVWPSGGDGFVDIKDFAVLTGKTH